MDLRRLRVTRAARVAFVTALTLCATAASASADVTIDKTGPAAAAQGAQVTYTITVGNTDAVTPATGVVITDPSPRGCSSSA